MANLDRKDIRGVLVVGTVVIIIAILISIGLWIYSGKTNSRTIIEIFIGAPLVIILAWIYYFNQKKQDEQGHDKPDTTIQKVIKADIKFGGVINRIKSIILFISSPILIIVGITLMLGFGIDSDTEIKIKLLIGILPIIIGIASFFIAKYFWEMSTIHLQGRVYKKD